MKIGFGSDHAAIELKACLLEHLTSKGYECIDFGAYSPDQKVDYPIAGRKVAEAIRRGEIDKGVLVCGTGVGISLAATKMVKEHNHCQIIAMGQRVVGTELAKMIVDNFFGAEELGGRHAARVDMITQIEKDYGYADAPIK